MTQAENFHNSDYSDPRASEISIKWFPLSVTATVEQKDQIGFLYISRALGLGDEIATKFAKRQSAAWMSVGLKQSALDEDADVTTFWEEVIKVFPDLLTKEDIAFLCQEGGMTGVFAFISYLDPVFSGESPVLQNIFLNASEYK